jgi:2-methylcitrate dehydratase PrpD
VSARQFSTAERLAEALTVLSWEDVPLAARHMARRCVLDTIACAAAGMPHEAVQAATAWAARTFSPGNASIWFTSRRSSSVAAGFANAFASSVLDIDDGHRAAQGHPGAAIIPAVLAEAEHLGISNEHALLAIMCGYEAGIGVARSRDPACLSIVATGRWAAIGVAAAIGKLRGLTSSQLADALAIAEAHAPNLIAADHAGFLGSDVKEGIPWSVITGFAAVDLAQSGLRGYRSSLDNPALYRSGLAASLKANALLIETTYFKPYACCRWIHSAIDAVLEIGPDRVSGTAIDRIEIGTFRRAATLRNPARPSDIIAAQFSVPFAVALAYESGPAAMLPILSSALVDEKILRLAEKIHVYVESELDDMYPEKVPARVKIFAGDVTLDREVHVPKGDPANPMTDGELVDKAVKLMSSIATKSMLRPAIASLLSPDVSGAMLWALTVKQVA